MRQIWYQEVRWNDEGKVELHEGNEELHEGNVALHRVNVDLHGVKVDFAEGFQGFHFWPSMAFVGEEEPFYGPIWPTQRGQVLGTFWAPNVGPWIFS